MTQQPFYPQAPVGYPPAPAQQYPQQPAPQYPGYPPQQAYGAPAPQQYAPQPAPQQLATGTIDDFYNQPSAGGGKSLKFEQIGTRYVGIVTRPISNGDVQQQTNTQGVPQFYKDGRPKFVMKVPLQLQPSQEYPDGLAQWYVKGAARDELARAMAEAGCPEDVRVPEAGAVIDITFTSTRQSGAGMNPAKVFQIRYSRPQGAAQSPTPTAPAQPAPQVAAAPAAPVEAQAQAMPPVQQPVPQQQFAQQPVPQVQPQAAPVQVAQAPAQVPAPQGAPQPPANLSPEQQALLAQLTGQQG